MTYQKFIIENYKAIRGPLEVDISRKSLVPIIGVNECGKTTILHAILSFDSTNDVFNSNVRHLTDVQNLYSIPPQDPIISAEIELPWDKFRYAIRSAERKAEGNAKSKLIGYRRKKKDYSGSIVISRNLISKKFSIRSNAFRAVEANHLLASRIVAGLPYILYFDDFRGRLDERIEIRESEEDSGWLSILETLFKRTPGGISIFQLPKMEARQRKNVLARVNNVLNKTLTREWQNFQLDSSKSDLRITLEYEEEQSNPAANPPSSLRSYLKFDVVETDDAGNSHYFYVTDRSKGFYWFFNFVMKLEFNPKVSDSADYDAIYLLDEPGSYLHANAQSRLCRKLRSLSETNKVIFCTHTHHLLNPEVIPINNIQISEKDGKGEVRLVPFHAHKGDITQPFSAYQPLADALQVRYVPYELGSKPTLIVEGMIDYYLFDMFKGKHDLTIFPSVGASGMKFAISLMIAWKLNYVALWDNDAAGQKALDDATTYFGVDEANIRFNLLPLSSPRKKKQIIQDFVVGNDLKVIRTELDIPSNSSFDKTITTLYYSSKRDKILKGLQGETASKFSNLLDSMFHELPFTL